ncbi:PREDICTED: uncharacterized protein LOC107073429 [Polistes dominula]|uniref:Uncharacterized protein LOC107073429 n=1 Tax=Polistes dominula TaxID=743375 RepID=A0ABM1JAR9_POLDO|nr:PREDICTED: uncharacterized protein LOC107073429 [Polistes dominula]XP_015189557.1 PREDICTED: uncharacterized protein LOC107073429 [Polistes dominula]
MQKIDYDDNPGNNYLAITKSTLTGFKITLRGTIDLLNFLHEKSNFDYLMTACLNQDKLELFFRIIRNACGCNEHSDPIIFGQVLRLLCSYSLVTPPKGSNVTSIELLESLMETKESLKLSKHRKLK